jgi:DNA-binding transcriptional regulator YiaG
MSILELRQMTGLSQRKFADKYQINFRNIQNWEQGVSKPPAYVLHMLYRLITEVDYKEQ